MSKIWLIPIFLILIVFVTSCDKDKDKTITKNLDEYYSDYGELVEKYGEMKFENCADAIAAGNEIVSVYYATADKAFKENDAKAKSDLENFNELLKLYDSAIESLKVKCPEDFNKWESDNRKKIESISQKADTVFNTRDNDTVFEDVTSKIRDVNEQVEQLMVDIQRFADEEDSAYMKK